MSQKSTRKKAFSLGKGEREKEMRGGERERRERKKERKGRRGEKKRVRE